MCKSRNRSRDRCKSDERAKEGAEAETKSRQFIATVIH